jgi:hypothetical protein
MKIQLLYFLLFLGLHFSLNAQSAFIDKALSANDHKRKNPLFDAINLGFNGISAELKLKKNGELYCGNKTLKEVYLEPLKLKSENGNKNIHPTHTDEFIFYLKIVSDSNTTFEALLKEIEPYQNLLTSFEGTKRIKKPVRIVIGGNIPYSKIFSSSKRYLFAEESVLKLDNSKDETFTPLAGLSLKNNYTWKGEKNMPNMEYMSLITHVKNAHQAGRLVRLYDIPELPNAFDILYGSGIDFIEIDDLNTFSSYWQKRNNN